ncbi:luciferase [Actinocatenispora thailandica]|uniref:Luciferase n=1 Tax=Actinocatenispora thailandica TaxID=227318 RepID=A0A7R7HWL2_9ACTN|nr:LLM class flavin-dependent oxidoreductase [Actinocatenispora thailandica]BCJ34998.1 luciferase [Actinocatenispora thailandica]
MLLSTVILPIYRWPEARTVWRRAEQLGAHAGYSYDHLSWRSFAGGPWYGTVPMLSAAALVTDRLRLGTMVTSPNFRHPVPLAKDLMTLDELSAGRVTAGIGAGSATGFDATVLGGPAWPAGERADRYAEFVRLLDTLLRNPDTTATGRYYSADAAKTIPGCVQRPRLPCYLAGTGPRGLRLAAELGDGWITTGPAGRPAENLTAALGAVGDQLRRLAHACTDAGRDPATLHRVLLTGFLPGEPLRSFDQAVELAGTAGQLGIDEVVVHWPVPDSPFAMDERLFDRILTELPGQLG